MLYLNRGFFWTQTKAIRSFYFVWQGDENIKKNDFQGAIDNYRKALTIYPEHAKAHYNLGNIYFWYELYTAPAEKKTVKVYRYNKKLDKFLFHEEKADEGPGSGENSAEAAYKLATKYHPNFINAWINLGLVRLNQYELDGAMYAFMKAVNANPTIVKIPLIFNNQPSITYNRAVAYYNLGRVYQLKADSAEFPELQNVFYNQAIRYYNKANEINPNSFRTNYNLALVYQLEKDNPLAIKHYCKAIELEPLKYEPHYNLGILLKREERYAEAAEEIKKAAMIIDTSQDEIVARYFFNILQEVSDRANTLAQAKAKYEKTYTVPEDSIIYEVVLAPLVKERKRQEEILKEEERLKQQEELEKEKDKGFSPMTDLLYKDFAKCSVIAAQEKAEEEPLLSPPTKQHIEHKSIIDLIEEYDREQKQKQWDKYLESSGSV